MGKQLLFLSALILFSHVTHAATLNVVGGELIGASGVLVSGNLYDVEFLDGTCIDLFSGCDQASDFVFNTAAMADAASQSLLAQVFGAGDIYDTNPELTSGITLDHSQILTPWEYRNTQFADWVEVIKFINWSGTTLDYALGLDIPASRIGDETDTGGISNIVWAVWTPVSPVPVPAAFWLFGSALIGLIGFGRRKSGVAA